jgi:hypothetical protein
MTPVFEMMEKVGVRYLYRLSGSFVPPEGGVVHILSEADRKAMRRLERNATWLIALAGAISAGIAVLAELTVLPLPEGQELGLQPEVLRHYGWVWGITLLATILEIAYIYYESLRATYRLAEIAGLDLFPDGEAGVSHRSLPGAGRHGITQSPGYRPGPGPPKGVLQTDDPAGCRGV